MSTLDYERLRSTISKSVVYHHYPAVFLGGGIDSTILLHHLREQTREDLYTYTFGVTRDPENEFEIARKTSKYYGTVHHEIELRDIIKLIEKYAPHLDRPRISLWVALLYEAARGDDRVNIYIGEGGDEHFGGYHYKPPMTYQEYWGPALEWSLPAHRFFANFYELNLHTPLLTLPIKETLPFWDDEIRNKTMLREAYKGILPDYVIETPKKPGRTPWLIIWDEIEPEIGIPRPETREEAQKIMSLIVALHWVKETLLI